MFEWLLKSMSQGVIPIYQKLTFHEIPQICFAHRYSTTCYDFRFSAAPHKMELTFFEKGDVVKMWEDGAQQHIAEGTFQFATFDRPFRVYSQASACSHTTVGFKAAYHLTTISREELLACNRYARKRADLSATALFQQSQSGCHTRTYLWRVPGGNRRIEG